jgi:uncharacterized protein with von Willebrand factor type A (vWA) domain
MTRVSSASRLELEGGPINMVTTQSRQAISLMVQVSQSMIMEKKVDVATDIPASPVPLRRV